VPSPRKTLTTLFVIVFTDLIGFGIVIPLLPLYAEMYRPSPFVFGLLMASFSAMQFVFAPILGRISDRVGRRPVLLVSLTGSVAGYLLFAAAHSLVWLFAARLVAGIAGANIATAQAVIADLTPIEERARGMGLIGAAFGLGFIAGPALGGLLVRWGMAAPGLGAALFSLAALMLAFFLLPESFPRAARSGGDRNVWGAVTLALAWRRHAITPLLAIGFAVVTGFAAFEVTFAQFLHTRLALALSNVAWMFVYLGVLAALVQGVFMGRLAKRFHEASLLLTGLTLTATGLLLLASAHTLTAVLAAMPALALGQGLAMPSLSSLISRSAGGDEQGVVLGTYQGLASLARVVGPFGGELALGAWGVAAPALAAAVLATAAALTAAVTIRHTAVRRTS